jgi:hypothetical protein
MQRFNLNCYLKAKYLYMYKIMYAAIIALVIFAACTKTTDTETNFVNAKEYLGAAKGKFIIYKLDSTITQDFGTRFTTRSYTVKDSVVDEFTDLAGNRAFKIFRFTLINGSWVSGNTFVLTPKSTVVELTENNLRYTSLASPVSPNQQWKGNSNIVTAPYYANSIFSTWNFTYRNIGQPKTYGTLNFANTITVVQFDSTENKPFNNKLYNFYDKGYEVYAKGVGLIYRDIMSWEYQAFTRLSNCKFTRPKADGTLETININCNDPLANCDSVRIRPNHNLSCDTTLDRFYYTGYGIKQTVLAHN